MAYGHGERCCCRPSDTCPRLRRQIATRRTSFSTFMGALWILPYSAKRSSASRFAAFAVSARTSPRLLISPVKTLIVRAPRRSRNNKVRHFPRSSDTGMCRRSMTLRFNPQPTAPPTQQPSA